VNHDGRYFATGVSDKDFAAYRIGRAKWSGDLPGWVLFAALSQRRVRASAFHNEQNRIAAARKKGPSAKWKE
jgi:hypothetical protein